MNATHIVVHSNNSPATSFPISRLVVRIGYGASYDVSLPESSDLQGLVATLRKCTDRWRVYNRSDHELKIGKKNVQVAEQSDWPEGETLFVDQFNTLTLQVQTTPDLQNLESQTQVPIADQRGHSDDETVDAKEEATDEAINKKKSNVGSIIVLAACGLVLVAMMTAKSKGPTVTSTTPSLVVILELAEKAEDAASRQLAAEIQVARAAQVRGDKRTATERFALIRAHLAPQRDRFIRDEAELEIEATRYVEFQLERLR